MGKRSRREFLSAGGLGLAGLLGSRSLSAAVQAAASPFRRPKLKITDIRTAEVWVHGYQVHVRVYTDQGIFGQGETTDAATGAVPLIRSFRRFLMGQDPLNVDSLFETLRTGGLFSGAQAGQYVAALSGVEIALWDLAGKALGLPVYQLLGGKVRDRIRVYCDMSMRTPLNAQGQARIQEVKDMRFTAGKMDIDDYNDPARFDKVNWTASNTEIDHMVEKVAVVRKSFDPKFDVAVDMHGRYDMTTAKRVAKEMEPFKLLWLEEPVPPENIDAMRDVRESTTTPIACGENLYLRYGFREVFEKRAADIIEPDLQKCGGLLEGRKIADMADTYYVPVAPHCVVSPVGMMASCHACAAIPNFLILEWHWISSLALWKNFVKDGEIIENGFVRVPDRPGIGVEMDEEAARKVQVPGTPWFEPTREG
jgi:galactonate dehydratase